MYTCGGMVVLHTRETTNQRPSVWYFIAKRGEATEPYKRPLKKL